MDVVSLDQKYRPFYIILLSDYYYESVAGAPGNGDVTYYTDVMETMIKDHLRDTFQLDSKVAITFDENYTITAVEVDVAVGELDTKNDIEDNVVSEKTAEKEKSFDRAADTTESWMRQISVRRSQKSIRSVRTGSKYL